MQFLKVPPQWRKKRRGSLLIDALLAVAIFGAIVAAFSSGIMQGQLGTVWGSDRIRATYLAEEGLQAVRWIRDQKNDQGENVGYDQLFAQTTGVEHGVKLVDGEWRVEANTPTTIDNFSTRSIRFSPGGNDDELIVESTVTWTSTKSLGSRSVTLSSILTNWGSDPPPPPPDWSQPILKSALTDTAFDEPSLEKVAVSGSYVYIAASQDYTNGFGLFVVDVSDLANPALVNSVDLGFVDAYDVVLRGHYAYLSTNDAAGEIRIVDVTDPETAACSPCAGTIDLPSNGLANGIAISGTGLFITREQDVTAGIGELYAYDLGDSDTNPPLIFSYDTNASPDSLYAVATTGSNPMAPYAYIAAGTANDEELRVVNTTGALLTGNGGAGSNLRGTAIAVYSTGAYVGAIGNDACELFSFNIANKVHNPNATPACGGNQSYDIGGINDPDDLVYDMIIEDGNSMLFPHLFMAMNAKKIGNAFRHLQIIDVRNVWNINDLSKRVYDDDITVGYGAGHGVAYRLSDHTLFMVGGDAWDTSHLLILWPTYTPL